MGDPNQAIYETFTTASPTYLIDFIESAGVQRRELPVSGRSTRSIQYLANHLIDWTMKAHPYQAAQQALRKPFILPTERGDPQPNPRDNSRQIYFSSRKMTPAEEIDMVLDNLVKWQNDQNELQEDLRETAVVLDLTNERGTHLADAMRKRGLDPSNFWERPPLRACPPVH